MSLFRSFLYYDSCFPSSVPLEKKKKKSANIHTVSVDLSDSAATRSALEAFGDIDLLVNNAGISKSASFLDCSVADFQE